MTDDTGSVLISSDRINALLNMPPDNWRNLGEDGMPIVWHWLKERAN